MRFLILLLANLTISLFPIEPSNHITLRGTLIKNPNAELADFTALSVFVKQGDRILNQSITDKNGSFILAFDCPVKSSVEVYCTGIGMDTLMFASFNVGEKIDEEQKFFFPIMLEETLLGDVCCPKCHKADQTIPYYYSVAPATMRVVKNGKTTWTNIVDGKYYAGCYGWGRYYCQRDKVSF